jgi:ferredoxin
VGCIVPGPKDDPRWTKFYIDPSICIDCWACVPECPEKAIFPDIELPPEHAESLEENARFFTEGPGYWDFDLEKERVRSTSSKDKPDTA